MLTRLQRCGPLPQLAGRLRQVGTSSPALSHMLAGSLALSPVRPQMDSEASSEASAELGAGWRHYNPPPVQEMLRRGAAAAPAPPAPHAWQPEQRQAGGLERKSEPVLAVLLETAPGQLQVAPRSWSVAY